MQTMHILNESLHIVVLESHAYHALLDVVVNVIIYVNIVVCQPFGLIVLWFSCRLWVDYLLI